MITRLGLAAGLVVAAAIASGCDKHPPEPEVAAARVEGNRVVFPPASPQLVAITTAPAKQSAPETVRLPGRLVWDEERTVRLYPAFAGRVVRIAAKPGDAVKPGQLLAQLASPDFGQAQSEARKSAADFALAEKSLARVRELVASGVAPQKELASAEADYARTQAERASTAERVKLYGGGGGGGGGGAVSASLALASPIAGIVVERNINPGQELRPDMITSNAPAMFVITDPTRLWLVLEATERDLPLLRPGQEVAFYSASYPNEVFRARLESVADFIDPQTRTIKVRGTVNNADRRLKGEMFVTAEIEAPLRPGFSVPAKAVFLQGNRQFVFVEEAPGRFARVEVTGAGERGGVMNVTSGLAPDQKVVVQGSLALQQIYQTNGGS